MLRLLVGIELQFAVRSNDITRRRLAQPFAATTAIQSSGLHALLELMQLETSHEALDRQDQSIIEFMGMIQSVFVGKQGVEGGAELDQAATGLVLAGETIDLKAENQANVPECDLTQQQGEIIAAGGGGAGAALIAVEDPDSFRWPAPIDSALGEIGLDLGRFAVAMHLLKLRLTNIIID
jgi:hypothetical protein